MPPPTDDPSQVVHRAYLGDAGAQLHVHEAGSPEGAPVVLLHRYGAAGDAWLPTLALGSWQVRLLAPDLPGAGLSDPVAGGDAARAAHLLDALRRTERRSLLLVADDDSARLGVELALEEPETVSGLVLLAPSAATADAVAGPLRGLGVPVWAASGGPTGALGSPAVEVPGARWLTLPGVGDEPVTDHPDLVLDLVHGAVAEVAASSPVEGAPQEGRRYITWVSSEACVNPSLSR